jgi:hypothetical protein
MAKRGKQAKDLIDDIEAVRAQLREAVEQVEATQVLPEPVACPACHRQTGVPIVYGMPTHELAEEAEQGHVALGGCVIFEDQPDYRCLACHHAWSADALA